ncbi:MAG: hypothetical protein MZU79_00210 [Anaerotruncus sp.]|nr:hypothetical protein [Anaerotruncus sp.]
MNDDVLKEIAMNREWLRNYQVKAGPGEQSQDALWPLPWRRSHTSTSGTSALLAKSKGVPRIHRDSRPGTDSRR